MHHTAFPVRNPNESQIHGTPSHQRTRQAACGPDGVHLAASACQNLVAICLVAHVPDELVLWAVKHVVQRNGQLHHTQAAAQMAASLGDLVHNVCAQLLAQLPQLLGVEVLDVHGIVDSVQERRRGTIVLPCLNVLHAELVPLAIIADAVHRTRCHMA